MIASSSSGVNGRPEGQAGRSACGVVRRRVRAARRARLDLRLGLAGLLLRLANAATEGIPDLRQRLRTSPQDTRIRITMRIRRRSGMGAMVLAPGRARPRRAPGRRLLYLPGWMRAPPEPCWPSPKTASPRLRGPDAKVALQELEDRYDELVAALQWFVDHESTDEALRLANALYRFWITQQRFDEGARLVRSCPWIARGRTAPSRCRRSSTPASCRSGWATTTARPRSSVKAWRSVASSVMRR